MVPDFLSVVYFSGGTLPQKRGEKGTTGGLGGSWIVAVGDRSNLGQLLTPHIHGFQRWYSFGVLVRGKGKDHNLFEDQYPYWQVSMF